ncbi:MAG: purine-nucleoside phosphorylase [Bacteroidota bacterium]
MIDRKKLDEAVRHIRNRVKLRPRVALILGSGLGDFADRLSAQVTVPSAEIPHYPQSTVQGHEGKLVFGRVIVGNRKSPSLLVFKGRVHYYETGSLPPVIFPVYVASQLGAKVLFVTNAAGGINRSFKAGQLMLIRDILALTFLKLNFRKGGSTHSGQHTEWPVPGTLANSELFDVRLQSLIRKNATSQGIDLQEGTYCWLKGPTYETASEVEMLHRIGADAVGMSTVPEIITAKRLGLRVAGISLISNLATGLTGEKLSHAEVTETANKVKESFTELMQRVLVSLSA